jgi:hypothetical protein
MIGKIVNAFDIYGQPIGVNFKGESSYKTKVGALMSLLTFGLGLALAGSKIMQMAAKDNANIQQLTNTLDLFSDSFSQTIQSSFNLENEKLEFIAGLLDYTTNSFIKIPPEMGSVKFNQTD